MQSLTCSIAHSKNIKYVRILHKEFLKNLFARYFNLHDVIVRAGEK